MKKFGWLAMLVLFSICADSVQAQRFTTRRRLQRVNMQLAGTVIDLTNNHGSDNRFWSNALCDMRDMYVYLPPCFDPDKRYPILLWLHGFLQDERGFLESVVQPFDEAIAAGKLPPLIIAAPDGTIHGNINLLEGNSFFINSNAGRFEDYLMQDVWPFLVENFPIHPDRNAHVLSGMSMGGFAAYNTAFKYRDTFGVAAAVFPPLNLRWVNCRDRYFRNFDPCCWGWRQSVDRQCETVGKFWCGLVRVPLKLLIGPLYDKDPDAVARMSMENPIEMLDRLDIQPGEFQLYVAYVRRDEFNIDAQVESFLYAARCRGVEVTAYYSKWGRHNMSSVLRFLPSMFDWLTPRLAPYNPDCPVEVVEPEPKKLEEAAKPNP